MHGQDLRALVALRRLVPAEQLDEGPRPTGACAVADHHGVVEAVEMA